MLSGSAIGTVRVLILYGSDVSNPSTLASNIISSMNDSFFDDKMDPDLHFTLADLRNLNDDLEDVCKLDIRSKMMNETAPFTDIATWIDDEDADIALTIVTEDPDITGCYYGSNGRLGGIAGLYLDQSAPYAITMDTYAIGDLTALHEVGHVLGGFHPQDDKSVIDQWGPNSEYYARGYISSNNDWQTVMGGYNSSGCDFPDTDPDSADCVRLPLWSDPTKSYDGETRGVTYTSPTQVPYSADMASALEIHMPIAAAFESYPDSVPSTPSNFSVSSRYCYGDHGSSWDSVSTAENYQLLMSIFSDFRDSDREVIYFGSNTRKNIMLPYGFLTYYFKVRACNGSGCSNWSAYDTATYYHGCL